MSKFVEHNNRAKAKKLAEYITGETLRRYLAGKVIGYCGEHPSVFDGASGSGQLEQYIEPSHVWAVEIQAESCQALKQNYPNATVCNNSFFEYMGYSVADCVVMNPPFAMKFKELTDIERQVIQQEFPWKKSGVVDDIFILKSLNYTSRYAFHICSLGIGYRKTEKKMRELIGTKLLELNIIKNGFDDTPIDVMLIVIDKEKTSRTFKRSIYDCSTQATEIEDTGELNDDFDWPKPFVHVEEEIISESDMNELNREVGNLELDGLENHLHLQHVMFSQLGLSVDYSYFFKRARAILDKYERLFGKSKPPVKQLDMVGL